MNKQNKAIKEELLFLETLVKQLKRWYNEDSDYGAVNNLCPEISKSASRLKKMSSWRFQEYGNLTEAYRNGETITKLK